MPKGMGSLGELVPPTGGVRVKRAVLPRRPSVIDDGEELDVIWYPHRDAQSLTRMDGPRNISIECPIHGFTRSPSFSYFG